MRKPRGSGRGQAKQDGTRNILRGVLLLMRGRRDGVQQFGDTTQAYLASLAPLIAFPLVGALLLIVSGALREGARDLLQAVCALLAPPVLSHLLARLWRRETGWLRYATALNWSQWSLPFILAVLLVLLDVTLQFGLPARTGGIVVVAVFSAYALWLHWFIGRHSMGLSRLRAVLLVLFVSIGTAALVGGPTLLGRQGDSADALPSVLPDPKS